MGATALINLERLGELIETAQAYSCEISDDVISITSLETGSQFIAEIFDDSVQIRQAVFFDYAELNASQKSNLQHLCSMMNERFSLTKIFVDRWNVVVTASDIYSLHVNYGYLDTILGQVEKMSLSALAAIELSSAGDRILNSEDLDGIFSCKH